jgi:hypothetical protein
VAPGRENLPPLRKITGHSVAARGLKAREARIEEPMTMTQREHASQFVRPPFEDGASSFEGPLSSLRSKFVGFVARYPKSSLVGAFALGFLIARAARWMGED